MDNTDFLKYKNLKQRYDFRLHGIELNRVLTPEFNLIIYNRKKFDEIGSIKLFLSIFKTKSLGPIKAAYMHHRIISTVISKRKDYKDLIDSLLVGVEGWKHISLSELKPSLAFHPFLILKIFFFVFGKKRPETLKEKILLATSLVYYANILLSLRKQFKNMDLSGKKYVPFNSAYDLEALFVQFFKQKKVETYHICHGVTYIPYKTFIPIDAVNGENITADIILVWGKSFKENLIKIYNQDPAHIIICGNPKYRMKEIKVSQTFKRGIVFLGRPVYDADNKELLKLIGKIAEEQNIHFSIKAHPTSNQEMFKEVIKAHQKILLLSRENTVIEILHSGQYDFAIAYNTTTYYEAMYYSMVCLRYAINENEVYDGLDDKFYDEASLLVQIEKYKKKDASSINQEITEILIDNFGMGINRYKEFFQ